MERTMSSQSVIPGEVVPEQGRSATWRLLRQATGGGEPTAEAAGASARFVLIEQGRTGWQESLCDRALEASWTERDRAPSRSVELAELAVRMAERLDPERLGRAAVRDRQARAVGELADALRRAERPVCALKAARRAVNLLEEGSGCAATHARVFEVAAEIFEQRGRWPLAATLLEHAAERFEDAGMSRQAGRALYRQALLLRRVDEPKRFLERVLTALERMDPVEDRELARQALRDLLSTVIELRWLTLAGDLLAEMRRVQARAPLDDSWLDVSELEQQILEARAEPGASAKEAAGATILLFPGWAREH
jgi:tetratricopeptide (TPR) repeat protein